jgi:uncharacterized protein (TIGR03435 family)
MREVDGFMLSRILLTCALMASVSALSQSFENITIRTAQSPGPGSDHIQILASGDLVADNVNTIALLTFAYDVPANPSPRFPPLPEWVYRRRYNVEAKAPANVNGSGGAGAEIEMRAKSMTRRLLADRFGLSIKAKQQNMPAYELVVNNGGLRLPSSIPGPRPCIFDTAPGGCHSFVIGFGHPLNGKSVDMDDLAHYIENWTDLPVVNRTGASGLFTMSSEGWRPMNLPPPPPGSANVDFGRLPSLDSVLDKVGLALRRGRATLPVYTVDHIQQPATN